MKNPDVQPLAPAPVPADVGIVMALAIEAGYLCDSLKRVRKYTAQTHSIIEGELAGKIVAVVLTGAGKAAARHGAEVLIVGHRPRWIISAGFAGGLDPSLARNDLVIPHQVIDLVGNLVVIEESIPKLPVIKRVECRLLTVDRLIAHPAEKADLHQLHGADLIDMETSAVAQLARERSIRFLPIRVISDDASAELPAEVARLLAHSGSYRMGVALRSIWHRPSALKDFWNLHARALESSDRLATCIRRVLEVLPPA
jgi:adenosylhomocysteine nucleosidase